MQQQFAVRPAANHRVCSPLHSSSVPRTRELRVIWDVYKQEHLVLPCKNTISVENLRPRILLAIRMRNKREPET